VSEMAADFCVVEPTRSISVELPAEPVYVLGNENELRQVIGNLLMNVRVHTDTHTSARIAVDASTSGATVTVHDDGPGMTATDARNAFDRFYRPDSSRSRETGGSGLGLSIAKTLTETHGGTIELRSSPSEGTTVRVHLPRQDISAAKATTA
jgi:two-component system, OmpR family, sensor kinase